MPLLAINISDKLFHSIKELVERGAYQSFENFLEVAAYNQLALERGVSPADIIDRGHRNGAMVDEEDGPSVSTADSADTKARAKEHKTAGERRRGQRARQKQSVDRVTRQVFVLNESPAEEDLASIMKPFALWSIAQKGPNPCDPVKKDEVGDEHVFGQVNRLFPLKIACRWLATKVFGAADGGGKAEWPVYTTISDPLADDAAKLGSLLEKWDAAGGRKRLDQLATGLPRRGNSASQDRFLSQFLARITRAGQVYPGAICQYQLARFQDQRIVLTQQGLAFAQFQNPILDTADAAVWDSLTPEESGFLLRQVVEWVPREREDMHIVLSAVADGKVTPTDLIQGVQARFPRQWTQSMVLTHISGLVARLADLLLLRRLWQGRTVQYQLGERQRVESFLKA